jgi:sensor histidine kinase YesM
VLTIAIPSLLSGTTGMQPSFTDLPPAPPDNFHQPSEIFNGPPVDFHGHGDRFPRLMLFRPEFSYSIFVFLFILVLSLGIRMIVQLQAVEKEKVRAELAFLKAQINPHFLFNTLNNIYSMAVNKREKTADAIEMFSEIMRFVILETQNDYVPLTKKIRYIHNYISLQKLRLSSNVTVNYRLKGNPGSLKIAPLILIPFIENAFKYGVSTESESVIDIDFEIVDNGLSMLVKNLKPGHFKPSPETTPMGIENTVKRLELIYPGRHKVNIADNENSFHVSLYLELND